MPEERGERLKSSRMAHIFCLAGLCAVSAELLAAYSDNTGNVPAVLFALVFFMGLYGAPTLLAREAVRRAGWGWPSLLPIFLALGIAQACIIDQSLFSESYHGYEGWEETREATFIPALSISGYNAYNFIIGHVIFSFAAPVAIAEAWRPDHASKPWLGPVGVAVAAVAYIGTALLIVMDPESQSASTTQLAVSIGLVLSCIVAAWLIGRWHGAEPAVQATRPAPRPLMVFGITLFLAVIGTIAGEGWAGLALGVTVTALVGALVWWGARQLGWDLRHAAAVGLAYLVGRGLFAFLYFPLAGEVEAIPKYAHNVTMLAVVLVAGWLALRPNFPPAQP